MPKFQLVTIFDSEEEMRAFVGGETKTDLQDATIVGSAPAPEPEQNIQTSPEERNDPADTGAITADVDADGMPYDQSIHSNPKAFTSGGLWRSARGKSSEANAARAAFKAAGGAETTAPAPTAGGMPGMPAAEVKAAPVSYDALIDRATDVLNRGIVESSDFADIYARAGVTDPAQLETNETLRVAVMDELDKLEA